MVVEVEVESGAGLEEGSGKGRTAVELVEVIRGTFLLRESSSSSLRLLPLGEFVP